MLIYSLKCKLDWGVSKSTLLSRRCIIWAQSEKQRAFIDHRSDLGETKNKPISVPSVILFKSQVRLDQGAYWWHRQWSNLKLAPIPSLPLSLHVLAEGLPHQGLSQPRSVECKWTNKPLHGEPASVQVYDCPGRKCYKRVEETIYKQKVRLSTWSSRTIFKSHLCHTDKQNHQYCGNSDLLQ